MALIKCSECGAQVSDRAPTCPQCGAPVAALAASTPPTQPAASRPKRRLVWLWWTIAGVAIVVVASAGVILWRSDQAQRQAVVAAQAEAWQSATSRIRALGARGEIGAEGTYFIIRSGEPGGPCTAAEIEDFWMGLVGFVPSDVLSLLDGPGYCNDEKQQDFARSVTVALDDTTDVLEALGVSEAAVAQLKSMRGLDGSQVRTETGTAAGDLTITFQYDGLNGVQVRVERTPGA